jgi:hypothetical protein
MKKMLVFSIVLQLIVGCEKELIKKPDNLISEEKMINIIFDLSLLEGMKTHNPALLDSFKDNSNEYIYKKYKIDSIQFAKSNIYYATDLKEYENMYTQVKLKMDEVKLEINSKIKANAKKDSLANIAKTKLHLKKRTDSIRNAKKLIKLKQKTNSVETSKIITH